MSNSSKLNELVRKHLQGRQEPITRDVIIEFNALILDMRKSESTIHSAVDKFFGESGRLTR